MSERFDLCRTSHAGAARECEGNRSQRGRTIRHSSWGLLVASVGLVAVACESSNYVGGDPVVSESDDPGLVLGYPEGPYGVDNGSIIQNMVFSGFFSETASTGVANEYIETIDFQQIRALGTFRFMLLNVGAEWCAGCRVEAQLLPGRFDAWAEQGGYVMSVIIEDQSARPATRNNLERWLATYPINYTMVHDPRGNINSRFAPSGLPLNVILDLENMEILSQKVGEDLRFLDLFESLLE